MSVLDKEGKYHVRKYFQFIYYLSTNQLPQPQRIISVYHHALTTYLCALQQPFQ